MVKLTFDKAFELTLLHESAAQNARLLGNPSPIAPVHFADPPGLPRRSPSGKTCFRCGGSHYATDCHFKDTVCNYCHKKGHIQRVCRSRIRQEQPRNAAQPLTAKSSKRNGNPAAPGNSISASPVAPHVRPTEPLPVNYEIYALGTDKKVDPYRVTVNINGAALQMEIDTGSALTLISQATFSTLWPQGKSPSLKSTSIHLRTYSGEELEVVGRAVVRVRCGGKEEEELGLVVVGGKGPSLLGRDWLGRLRLDWREIRKLHTTSDALETVLAKHSNLFRHELGTISGITAKLHVSPDANPLFYRPRSIPYALRSRVDQALEKLVSEGILEAVQFSEWAAPIVPVVKQDGSIRVCGDYKLTINQVALVDTYPLPLVQDIFASLANGKSFTKLDLAHAYQQLPLDSDSRLYMTINTHRGLFQYTRLPFGVAAAPAIFQRMMESLLGDIPHVCVYLDYILVTGESETAHLQNLAAVLERLESAGIRLKREKCSFMNAEVEYLGHSISAKGMQRVSEKVRAVRDAP